VAQVTKPWLAALTAITFPSGFTLPFCITVPPGDDALKRVTLCARVLATFYLGGNK
jgi:hypothetical protein